MYQLWYYRFSFTLISSEIEGGVDMTDVLDHTKDVPPGPSGPTFGGSDNATDVELLVAVKAWNSATSNARARLPELRAMNERIKARSAASRDALRDALAASPSTPTGPTGSR